MAKWGFIGLGSQGAPMAQRMIDSGNDVVLWARRPESLVPFENSSARVAESVAALAEEVEHCGICVVDDAGVVQVCEQLIPAMTSGGCIAIHSTVNPELCKTLEEQAKARGLMLVDAPVSGGGAGATDGTLTVMVGGEDYAVAAARPVFETFAGLIVHLGAVGSAQNAKLVNNSLMAANLDLAYQALQIADSLDIDRDAFVELVRVSSGRSFSFDVCARMPEPRAFKHGAGLLAKDLGLLGEAVGDNSNYITLRDVANRFLSKALMD